MLLTNKDSIKTILNKQKELMLLIYMNKNDYRVIQVQQQLERLLEEIKKIFIDVNKTND